MSNDKYVVLKLVSSEEVVAHLIKEDDYEIRVLFPMIVKYVPRIQMGRMMESITLAPYTYFSADDEYSFHKNQIIFMKDLDPKYEPEYNRAIDDFVAGSAEAPQPEYNPQELQQITDKLQNLFRENLKNEDDLEELPSIHLDISKTIH